ncbi:hypothetical protein Tco_0715372 [Tanacetum coccineum]
MHPTHGLMQVSVIMVTHKLNIGQNVVGNDDNFLCSMRALLRPVSWMGNHTEHIIAATSSLWCRQRSKGTTVYVACVFGSFRPEKFGSLSVIVVTGISEKQTYHCDDDWCSTAANATVELSSDMYILICGQRLQSCLHFVGNDDFNIGPRQLSFEVKGLKKRTTAKMREKELAVMQCKEAGVSHDDAFRRCLPRLNDGLFGKDQQA